MREALSKRSSSQRPSTSTSRSATLKSNTSSKKKATSGRAHSHPLIQAKSKPKVSASKAAAKAAAGSRSARGLRSAKVATTKAARGKKSGKRPPAASTKALKSLRASRSSKVAKPKAPARTLTAKKAVATKAARVIKASKTRVKTSQKAVKATRPPIPAYVERVVPLDTPRRKPASGALKAFEHAVRVFNKRQFGEARELFDLVQHRFPQEVEIVARSHTYMQVCSQRMQRPPTSPRSADELYDRGVFHLNIGDFTQARQLFEKALRLSPGEPHLLYSLAASHAQSGSHDEALTFLDQLIQEHPRFRTQALNDSDFSELHENKRFLEILGVSSLLDIIDSRREP